MAFNKLPVELNSEIACYLSDHDLVAFARTCHASRAALQHPSSSVWRIRFVQCFDLPPRASNEKLKAIYQYRKKILRHGASFTRGKSRQERECLQVLSDLIVEAYIGHGSKHNDHPEITKNLQMVEKFARHSNILQFVLCGKWADQFSPLLLTIQSLLIHIQLDLSFRCPTYGFPDSRSAAYASAIKEPLFVGPKKTEVNMNFVSKTLNFFKYHMIRKEHFTLYEHYENLEPEERVRPWSTKLVNGVQQLGRSWKGAYAYLDHDELAELRQGGPDATNMEDKFRSDNGNEAFQTLELEFPSKPFPWPPKFENSLHSLQHPSAKGLASTSPSKSKSKSNSDLPRPRKTRSSPRGPTDDGNPTDEGFDPKPVNFQFLSLGEDGDHFAASGWLNPLPSQHGIPGWQRWTMMKYFLDFDYDSETGSQAGSETGKDDSTFQEILAMATESAIVQAQELWAYEGVVLPGGQVVVGRWWHPKNEDDSDHEDEAERYSGPFMFWCVDA